MEYQDIITELKQVLAKAPIYDDTPESWHLHIIESILDDSVYQRLCEERDNIIDDDAETIVELLPYIYGNMNY